MQTPRLAAPLIALPLLATNAAKAQPPEAAPAPASVAAPESAPESASAPVSAPVSASASVSESASAPAFVWPELPCNPGPTYATRSLRIGPSVQALLYDPFPFERISKIGTGIFAVYEFFLKPSATIGINLSYRVHPGESSLHQIGYGLMLKHYLAGTKSPNSTFLPFVEYGLLLQMSFLSHRKGSGTAHDTRLSAGTDIRVGKRFLFVEGSWHYSRLGLFEQKSERLDSVEFDLGYRLPW